MHTHWIIMDTINTPPIAYSKIIQSILSIKYLHEGIAFLLGFVRAVQYLFKSLKICYGAQRIYNLL